MTEDHVQATANALNNILADASPSEIMVEAVGSVMPGRLAVVSSFGTESAALLKLVADVDPTLPVLFVDTGWLFAETLAYRDVLAAHFGLTDVRVIASSAAALARDDPQRELWSSDPDACCRLRKVIPLEGALGSFEAWINGRKRFHGQERARLPIVERDGCRLKFNPLARASKQDIERIFVTHALPCHPLAAQGFASVGCVPCTSRTLPSEPPRAGRWRGRGKTECGIHANATGTENKDQAADRQNRRAERDDLLAPTPDLPG